MAPDMFWMESAKKPSLVPQVPRIKDVHVWGNIRGLGIIGCHHNTELQKTATSQLKIVCAKRSGAS